jgi:methyl-accepting chemotaxis protein
LTRPAGDITFNAMRRLIPQTIAGRLVLFIGLTYCLILAGTVSFNYARTRRILVAQIDTAALKQTQIVAAQVDDFLARAATRAEMLASHEVILAGMPASARPTGPQNTMDRFPLLAQMLKDTPEDEAYGLWFCANIGGEATPLAAPTPLTAIHRHTYPNHTVFPKEYLDSIPNQEWYAGPHKTGKPYITEPYYDDGGGNISMVSISHPCIDNQGRIIGITGVDLSLDHIYRLVAGLHYASNRDQQGGFAFLVSGSGRVIAHPDARLKLGKDTPGAKLDGMPEGPAIAGRPNGDATLTCGGEDRRLYWATAPVSGWKVVLNMPNTIISGPVRDLALRTSLLGLTGVLLSCLLLVLVARGISRPIVRLTAIAQQVAEGNLHGAKQALDAFAKPGATGYGKAGGAATGETIRLFHAIRTMTDNLSSLLGQVQRSSVQVMSTATQINATAKQQETTVGAFGGATSQITASAKEISATSQGLLGTMDAVSEVASHTAGMAADGRTLLQSRQDTLNQLLAATGSISGKLSVISQRAGDINLVVTTITKVADQTNLLSINAAIEAEKAGESGLGFLVVAREIRRLADQTAVATLDIERMVKEMQTSVSSGVMEMDKFSQGVGRAVEEMGGLTGQLDQIIQHVQGLTTRFDEVNVGMRAQSQGATQISEAMVHLNDAARQTATSLNEFNSATRSLSDAVLGLKNQVSLFRIES